jgi:hypothetical protein
MEFFEFATRFDNAVVDFATKRRIRDELSATAAVKVAGLTKQGWQVTSVVHAVMLVQSYPEIKLDVLMSAYHDFVPWWDRAWYSLVRWHACLADHPDPLPKLRER